jgi:hypothetical protein
MRSPVYFRIRCGATESAGSALRSLASHWSRKGKTGETRNGMSELTGSEHVPSQWANHRSAKVEAPVRRAFAIAGMMVMPSPTPT